MGEKEMTLSHIDNPFNTALEIGIRALAVLAAIHPRSADLKTLIELDYLMIHSGDAGGPESIHPPLPMRSGELLVRRGILERGTFLMISRGLALRNCNADGFNYSATEAAAPFLEALRSPYFFTLRQRAHWVSDTFGHLTSDELTALTNQFFQSWSAQFQIAEQLQDAS